MQTREFWRQQARCHCRIKRVVLFPDSFPFKYINKLWPWLAWKISSMNGEFVQWRLYEGAVERERETALERVIQKEIGQT